MNKKELAVFAINSWNTRGRFYCAEWGGAQGDRPIVNDKTVIGTEPFYDAARAEYLTATDALTAPVTAASIEAAIASGNDAKRFAVLGELDDLAADASSATVLATIQKLAAVVPATTLDIADVKTDAASLEDYRDAILAIATYGADNNAAAPTLASVDADITDVVNAIESVNNPSAVAAMGAVQTEAKDATATAASFLVELQKLPSRFPVIEENAADYLADKVAIDAEITDAGAVAGDEAGLIEVLQAINAKVELNNATTVSAANTALLNFAVATGNTTFINLSSTGKLELAEMILADIEANGAYADIADVTAAITAQDAARTDLIADVNDACDTTKTIVAVDTALEAIGYDAYDNLTATKQIAVAEAFLNAYPKDEDGVVIADHFTTLTAIKAAIDAAIAATN